MKKFVSLLLTLTLLLGLCGAIATAEAVPTITILMAGDNTPAEDNSVLRALGEKFGCKVEIQVIPEADYAGKLNSLIASNTLPDLFQIRNSVTLKEMAEAGRLYNMAPALDEYAPDIKAYYGDSIYKSIVNDPDTGIYALFSEAGLYVNNLGIRKDWLAKLGKEIPTNLDELYDVLNAFTYDDPDGNGQNDTYGIALSTASSELWENLMAAFDIPIKTFDNPLCQLEDGTVTTIMKHPRFLEAIEYLRKLYQARLFDPDFTTLTLMQCFEKLWNSQVGMLGFRFVGTTNNWYPGRYTFEVPADPSELFGTVYLDGKGSIAKYARYDLANAFAINAASANPELALAIGNYMWYTEEGQNLTYLGVEGVHYEWVDKEAGVYQRLGEFKDDVVHRADGAFAYASAGGYTKANAETRMMNKTTQDAQAAEWEKVIDWPFIIEPLEADVEYGADLSMIFKEAFAELIVTTGDVQEVYNEYLQRWLDEGGEQYEAEATAAYAAQ